MSDESQDNAFSTESPGTELKVHEGPRRVDKPAILAALNKLRKGGNPDVRTESKQVRAGEQLGEPGAMDPDHGDLDDNATDMDQEDRDLGMDGDDAESVDDAPEPAEDDAPPAANEPEPEGVELSEEQAAKLRIRQENQRLRAKQKAALEKAERLAAEREAEVAAARREREQFEADRKADAERREKANKDPYGFLKELTGQDFDDLVRGKLEEGTPEAKISALQKQNQALAMAIKDINDRTQKEKDDEVARRKEAEERDKQTAAQRQAQDSQKAFLDLAKAKAAKYPVAAQLANSKASYLLVGLGYSAHFQFMEEHGRPGTQEELLASIEKAFEGEVPKPVPGKKPGAVRRGEPAPAPKPPRLLTDEEKKEAALKELQRMRGKTQRSAGAAR